MKLLFSSSLESHWGNIGQGRFLTLSYSHGKKEWGGVRRREMLNTSVHLRGPYCCSFICQTSLTSPLLPLHLAEFSLWCSQIPCPSCISSSLTYHKMVVYYHIYLFFTFPPLNLPSCSNSICTCCFLDLLILHNPYSHTSTHLPLLTGPQPWPEHSIPTVPFTSQGNTKPKLKVPFLYPFVFCTLNHTKCFSNCWQPVTAFTAFCISEFNKFHGWKPCMSNLNKWGIQMQLSCVFMNSMKCRMTSHSNRYMGLGAFASWRVIMPETDCAQRKMICMKMHSIINCHSRNGTWQPSCPTGLLHTSLSRRNGAKDQAHIKFTDRYQNILWFSETVGSQVAFKGARERTGYVGHWRGEFGGTNIFNHLQPSRGLMHLEVNVCVLKVPVVENGTLPNNDTHFLPCVRGLHLSLNNSFMQRLKLPDIEFLVLLLRNKMPDTMNAWHHIMHSQWQVKGVIFLYYKICNVRGSCLS